MHVLTRHYGDYNPEHFKRIYNEASLKIECVRAIITFHGKMHAGKGLYLVCTLLQLLLQEVSK